MRAYRGVVFNQMCEDIQIQQSMANKPESSDEIPWNDKVELLLLFALMGFKPVGVNRNFMMLFIHDRFSRYANRQVHSKTIWEHLESMYDMAAFHESEILPFPSEEVDFELPAYLDDLAMDKLGASLPHTGDESSQSKMDTSLKFSKKIATSKLKQSLTPIINKSKEIPHSKQTTPTTQVSHKSGKSTPGSKVDEKPVITESAVNKSKQDLHLPTPAKITKSKRSSSPFSVKSSKSETVPSREESPEIPIIRKPKLERSGSPASVVKKSAIKLESSSTPVSSKKVVKEHANSSSKHGKSESTDSPLRKNIKNERDSVGKKGKVLASETAENKKSGKPDNSNGVRKLKSDSESSAKKVDSSSNKQLKVDVKNIQNTHTKGLKLDDIDASILSGSRKSSPMVKLESVNSIKKRKRQKVEDSPKKPTAPPPKRRR